MSPIICHPARLSAPGKIKAPAFDVQTSQRSRAPWDESLPFDHACPWANHGIRPFDPPLPVAGQRFAGIPLQALHTHHILRVSAGLLDQVPACEFQDFQSWQQATHQGSPGELSFRRDLCHKWVARVYSSSFAFLPYLLVHATPHPNLLLHPYTLCQRWDP